MKFKADPKALNNAVLNSSVSISCSSTNPALCNFLLQVKDNILVIQGTDLELSTISKITVTDAEDGQALVNAAKFSSIASFATDSVEFCVKDSSATVRVGRSKHTLLVSSAEYPSILDFDEAKEHHTLDLLAFLSGVQKVMHAVCTDETRKQLLSVNITEGLMVASDGQRVASFDTGLPVASLNIPSRCASDLVKVMMMSQAKQIKIQQLEQFLIFKMEGNTFSSRLLSAEFPNVKAKLSGVDAIAVEQASFNKKLFIDAIQRTSISADEESKAVALVFSKGECHLVSKDKVGNISEDTLAFAGTTKDIKYFVNSEHVLDCLSSLEGENITVWLPENSKKNPALKFAEGRYKEVLMPQVESFQI